MDIWIFGYMDIWIYGYMDIWIYGYLDICKFGYIYIYILFWRSGPFGAQSSLPCQLENTSFKVKVLNLSNSGLINIP